MIDSIQALFDDTLKDTYNAEKQFLKGMQKLMKASQTPELKQAFEKHIKETEGHIERLEKVAEMLEIKPSGKVCKAAQGLVEEAEEDLGEVQKGPLLDAIIIACAQKNEHYEICAYGTLIAWAEQMEMKEVLPLLQETLEEEKAADRSLTEASTSVNAQANQEGRATLR
ncbi:MAG TPA: ferritin-like domain-containing protein [Fimbriimonadaceae bacterium]|nr:ferritin-like domain-containing protein [Fimbriimonadaceae bacterium]